MLPLKRFYFHSDGTPFAQCIECRNFYLGRDENAGTIPWEDALPVFERLWEIYGGKTKAAEALGLQRNAFSRNFKTIRRKTFNAARRLLDQEDDQRRFKVGEAEVVTAEPLGAVLRNWIVMFMRERPNGVDNVLMGPINWLSEKTEINERRISGIANGEFSHVPLSQTDALLTAIGRPDLLGIEIHVMPNPNWSMEWWLDYMAERGCV